MPLRDPWAIAVSAPALEICQVEPVLSFFLAPKIMPSPIVKRKDEAAHGEYRAARHRHGEAIPNPARTAPADPGVTHLPRGKDGSSVRAQLCSGCSKQYWRDQAEDYSQTLSRKTSGDPAQAIPNPVSAVSSAAWRDRLPCL